MARKARFPELAAERAQSALRWLHALGKVTGKDIEKALGEGMTLRRVAERARLPAEPSVFS